METPSQCSRCLYDTSHPLGLEINEKGICSGCLIHEEKDYLDWDQRWNELLDLVNDYKCKQKVKYDCIVPVSGANDSYFILHIVKNKLNLNPLVVTYNKYFNTPIGIKNLANLRTKFDVDVLIQNINPTIVKKITKTTLFELGSMYWPCIAGQTVFPVQTSIRYNIPLIIWGAHQGLEQVGMFSHLHNVEMTRRYRKDHDLMGMEADDMLNTFNTLSEEDICQYRYPSDSDLRKAGTRGIYLGNYIRWDPKAQHEKMIKLYGYESASLNRTFETYDHIDCYNYLNIHDYLKYLKTGFSKVTDHACREIRHGRLTKPQAKSLVSYYENRNIQNQNLFYDWLGVDENSFNFILRKIAEENNRNPNNIEISHRKKNKSVSSNLMKLDYKINSFINRDKKTQYITIGKGYP
tara:strand:- start:2055 stop:3275 length:1221 start_codon:yes stop_codon:yes gene_type:complete